MKKRYSNKRKKAADFSMQERQDEIFRSMPISRKIKLTADLSALCLKLNRLGAKDGI